MGNDMKSLLIWGAGDQGTVTLECALAMDQYDKIDFLEIQGKGHREIYGHTVYREQETDLDSLLNAYDEVIVATGDNVLRAQKLLALEAMGSAVANIIHPTAMISPSACVGKGCAILPYAVVHTNALVGRGCIINTAAVIEHDCVIGDFSNISPRAAIAGHTKIGRKSFLGIGSCVINGITVGEAVVIGAGASVIRDVPGGVTVAGVPAKIIGQFKNMPQ